MNTSLRYHEFRATSSPLDRWLQLLKPDGVLILIEGHWSTGAGLMGTEALELVRAHDRDAILTPLPDPLLWGGAIADERYLLVSRPARPAST